MRGASPMVTWRIARGVALHVTAQGIVVEGPRIVRIRLKERELEAPLVQALAGADLTRVRECFGTATVDDALRLLRDHDAIVAMRRKIAVADRVGAGLAFDAEVVLYLEHPGQLEDADLLVVVARRNDATASDFVASARAKEMPVLLGWIDRAEVVFCAHEANRSPCVLCALSLDSRAPRTLVPQAEGAELHAHGDASVRKMVQALVERFSSTAADIPAPGRAFVFDVDTCHARWESFSRHPSCICEAPLDEPATFLDRAPDWDDLASRRFGPVVPVDRGDELARPARVLYRGSRSPWPVSRAAHGVALASGKGSADRALAEAFERFAMLHAPPDVRAKAARELDAPSLDPLSIAALLHRDEEYAGAGFRFPRFSNELVLDWSWADHANGNGKLLVPTSLIGRPSRASVKLVDATSNGYACHPSRDEARTLALLEILERDAVLMAWYADEALPHIEGLDIPKGAVAMLATQDVDVPVIVLAKGAEDGSLRTATAASLHFDAAVDAARRELDGQLAQRTDSERAPVGPLDRPDAKYGPVDHTAFYSGGRGREVLLHMARSEARLDARELRVRWPRRAPADRLSAAIEVVLRAGLEPLFIDRSLPDLFGRWRVTRALVPRTVEMSWGQPHRRLACPRLLARLSGRTPSLWPHPYG